MIKLCILLVSALLAIQPAVQRENVWPKGKMPHACDKQIGAMTYESNAPGFKPEKYRQPYLDWFEAPEHPNGTCMILISGGGYNNCCDMKHIEIWRKTLTERGVQCVNFVYRTPRPEGIPYWQTAWEDGQRAVRKVRSEAARRGFDPEKIGVVGMSAGSHLGLLLGTSSQTRAYAPVDKLDSIPCHINLAILHAPAYVTTDADDRGTPALREGYGVDVALSKVFRFDEKTCPMSLHHGGTDKYSPNGSTQVYRQLRRMGIPAELHLYPGKGHGVYGFDRGVEFMTQLGFLGELQPEEALMDRYASDADRACYSKEPVWPEGKMPGFQENQCVPYIEWHIPAERKTDAIQIIYSGGSYQDNNPDGFEVAPARRYLNAMGITVVTLKYRTPRPAAPLAKHTSAWQDLQRTIRIVRSKAPQLGLDPNKIGIMGSSAGGHLTLMGVTSSRHKSYYPIDALDKIPCNVQWGIGIYPAYALTDGSERPNAEGGNEDDAVLVPEFSFDLDTAPMLLIHGDGDNWAAMNSVKVWEKMRAMGIQSELHTLATRKHCFQRMASPGTGSYTWLDRIGEYLSKTLDLYPEGARYANRAQAIAAQIHDPKSKYVVVACHRGDWRNYPENSLPAIESVIRMGADVVELDVRMTADSALVLCHDADVLRTTNFFQVFRDQPGKSAKVADLTLAEIRRLGLNRAHQAAAIDTLRMPTLREALLCAKDRICVNIDKGYDYYDAVLALTEELGVTDQVLIKGKQPIEVVAANEARHPRNMMYMPVVDIQRSKGKALMQSYLEQGVVPLAYEVCWQRNDDGAFADACKQIIGQGSKVWVNTIWSSLCGGDGNDDDAAFCAADPGQVYQQYLDAGVSLIQTDRPELLIGWLNRLGRHTLPR